MISVVRFPQPSMILRASGSPARFYLEPVDEGANTVDDAVRQQVVRG
jgi:hypothetical protein